MRINRPRLSTVLLGTVFAGGLFLIVFAGYQAWASMAPVRASYYEPVPWSSSSTINPAATSSPTSDWIVENQTPTSNPSIQVVNKVMGTLFFPSLKQKYEVFEGTTSEVLNQGVGHLQVTSTPGESGNSVLAGHRETVFQDLGKLNNGDVIQFVSGDTKIQYVVVSHFIVDASNKTVAAQKTRETLTLVTCYPFTKFGPSPSRYIVVARPV